MNKKDLVRFIENSRSNAVCVLDTQFIDDRLFRKLNLADTKGVIALAETVQMHVEAAYTSYMELKAKLDVDEDVKLRSEHYGSVGYVLSRMLDSSVLKIMIETDMDDTTEENHRCIDVYKQTSADVRANYRNVDANVRNIPKIGDAIDYVKSLGFELPEDAVSTSTALMNPVDTRYLLTKNV